MIKSIPNYIKVRGLLKLTTQDKENRKILREQARFEREQKAILNKNKLNALKQKLDLTDEDVSILRGGEL